MFRLVGVVGWGAELCGLLLLVFMFAVVLIAVSRCLLFFCFFFHFPKSHITLIIEYWLVLLIMY